GSAKEFPRGATGLEIAESIGKRLAQDALAIKIGGELKDVFLPLEKSAPIRIVTWKDKEGMEVFRHSTAHLLAQAVLRLFPEAKPTIGPVVEEGFYYDFDLEHHFTPEDLARIEQEMMKIAKEDRTVERMELDEKEAKKLFKDNPYKLEIIDEQEKEGLSAYKQGEFTDLCRGPHVPRTGMLRAVKLTKLAGAYWRGDAKNRQLQRIYGISFPEEKMLKQHLAMLEEAKKRDHRVLGQKLDLFSFDEVSPGAPFFHPKGTIIYNELLSFIREEYRKRGYDEVITPLIYDRSLWEASGHWQHYRENMFVLEVDGKEASLKSMNCPSHCVIYGKSFKSYRDLPLRIADFAPLHRNELRGVLAGATRVRKFSQDDAHIFLAPGQVEGEIFALIDFLDYIYTGVFDFEYSIELSTKPESALGSAELWEKAEASLASALKKKKLPYRINAGDGAFYGPKIDFHIRDALGRNWQLGTIQLDFNLPERFGLEYEDKDGRRKRPIMIHRALLGSIERFMAILIEHYAGKFPLWLAPEQVRIVTVADAYNEYAEKVAGALRKENIRVRVDKRAESIPKKVREAQLGYIPLIVTVGEKEASSDTVAVRTLDGKVKFGVEAGEFVRLVRKIVAEKALSIGL
ncbi:TPA: threonine--tRNA ligase, partial [Candidatus Woesearchaeota archaeon]|nr:threonine--tRNA ligase [Candidatus Woesearchaeota archaeon]HII64676.1 threonine--tRNA ligase [Candidatus Woesearchaeota archaeon]